MKYLLSTGRLTDKMELYIIDLFKLYLSVWPGDIPGARQIGFDFILTDTSKDELVTEIRSRVDGLISRIKEKFNTKLEISVTDFYLFDNTRIKLVLKVNEIASEDITINIYDNNA